MKKRFCSVLCLVLVLALAVPSLADGFDLSEMRENSGLYEIDVDSDRGVAFVSSTFTSKELSFEHKYDSSAYYSSLYNDLIVLDYFGTDSYPVWRVWIEYYGTQHIYATQVSFTFNGSRYTFSGVADSDRVTNEENGDAHETLLIKFGTDNMDFILGMLSYGELLVADAGDDITGAVLENCSITMTLSGTEDITVEVSPYFMLDFYLATIAFLQGDVSSNLSKVSDPTTLKVTALE